MADRGLLFRSAMITCLGLLLATGRTSWLTMAVMFALACLSMLWAVQAFLAVLP